MEHSVKPSDSNAIEISVVIPVRNEEDSVRIVIDGLLGQTLLPNEIVITDGGSLTPPERSSKSLLAAGRR